MNLTSDTLPVDVWWVLFGLVTCQNRYEGWIADRMRVNVEKRLLQLDLNMTSIPI